MPSFAGKVVLVTGAARGQGRSHCVRFADLGADIVALDLCAQIETVPYPLASESDLDETVHEVEKRGQRIIARKADVRDHASLATAVDEALEGLGRLDVVIANAGIAPLEVDPADPGRVWTDVVDTNLTGAFNTAHAAAPAMRVGGAGGSIVFVNSTAGLKGSLAMRTVGGYAYAASKHGLVGLTRAFAFELAPHDIRVNAIHPAGVDTPMVNNAAMEYLKSQRDMSAWTNPLPVGRIGVGDMSDAVLWITSDEARYITGVSLPVDAGFTVK